MEGYQDLGYPSVGRAAGRTDCASRSDSIRVGTNSFKCKCQGEALRGNSNADSPTRNQEGELIFVKPWEEQQPFSTFIDFVSSQELLPSSPSVSEVHYAQTRPSHVIPPPLLLLPFYLTPARKRQPAERIRNPLLTRRERHFLGKDSTARGT